MLVSSIKELSRLYGMRACLVLADTVRAAWADDSDEETRNRGSIHLKTHEVGVVMSYRWKNEDLC